MPDNTVRGLTGATGARGPRGPQGFPGKDGRGPKGDKGDPGVNGINGTNGSSSFYLSNFLPGLPLGLQTIYRFIVPVDCNISDVRLHCEINPTAFTEFSVKKNNENWGYLNFNPDGYHEAAGYIHDPLVIGDIISIVSPENIDATLSDITFVFVCVPVIPNPGGSGGN